MHDYIQMPVTVNVFLCLPQQFQLDKDIFRFERVPKLKISSKDNRNKTYTI